MRVRTGWYSRASACPLSSPTRIRAPRSHGSRVYRRRPAHPTARRRRLSFLCNSAVSHTDDGLPWEVTLAGMCTFGVIFMAMHTQKTELALGFIRCAAAAREGSAKAARKTARLGH